MKYRIKYNYQTGDSFRNSDVDDILEMEWENLDIAKANLKRIQEHYTFYQKLERTKSWCHPEFSRQEIIKDHSNHDWLVKEFYANGEYDETSVQNCIILYSDKGKPWRFWAPWCGYFERLYDAEIINIQSDTKISFR